MILTDTFSPSDSVRRLRLGYGLMLAVIVLFGVRLFYIQVIRYDHYKQAALHDQLKQYEIPASRGLIEAYDANDNMVPIVLNQQLYTLYADPTYVKHPDQASLAVAKVIGGDANNYKTAMTVKDTRYSILAKKLTKDQSDKILKLQYAGLGTQEQDYRTYPQGSLAAQLLGFVDNSGKGQYGIEQALNKQLSGTPGQLKAITSLNGVPLAASKDNTQTAPVAGSNVGLTVDLGLQAQTEKILADEYQKTKSKGLSAVILDPHTGAVKAMANYPSYDPANYNKVSEKDQAVFQNNAVSNAIEPGSTMKLLTTAAALNLGVIKPDTSFYDPAKWVIDDFTIKDIEEDGGARTQNIESLLNLSLNTGATWELMQMGGGEINRKARDAWYDYMVNHFQLGKETGIEQGYEADGSVPSPENNGAGINLTYANTSFGQALEVTALQMAGALSSVLNGGTFYKPYMVAQTTDGAGHTNKTKPQVVARNVVSPQVSQDMMPLMEYVVQQHLLEGFKYLNFDSSYAVGGKTGTAQIANPNGGYYADKYNGTYAGFVGGDAAQYVIVVYNTQPGVAGYAGANGGQPVFADLAHMLIDDGYVTPRSQ